MSLVIEAFEATRTKRGDLVFTFDSDELRPAGDLISATIMHDVLTLSWADGSRCLLPDVRDRLAERVTAAPVISVRWVADRLTRGADFQQR
jgi:hypothetical protein